MKIKLKQQKFKLRKPLEQKKYVPPAPKQLQCVCYDFQVPVYFRPNEYEHERPKLMQCAYCEVGNTYVDHAYNAVLTCVKKDTKDTSDIRVWSVTFHGRTTNGDCVEYTTQGISPVVDESTEVKDAILEKHYKKNKQEMIVMEQGKKKVVTKKAVAAKARAGRQMDPKTGCTPGTIAHDVGTIMLKVGTAPEKRGKCIEKITAFLLDSGTEEKKAKTLAASWYSTLKNRKAHIYGTGAKTQEKSNKKPVADKKPAKSVKLKIKTK